MEKRTLNIDAFVKLLASKGISLDAVFPHAEHNEELRMKDIDHAKLMADSFFIVRAETYPDFSSKEYDKLLMTFLKSSQRKKKSLSLNGKIIDRKMAKKKYHQLVDEIFT